MIKKGKKVKICKTIDLFPFAMIEKGERGEIVNIFRHGDPLFHIKLNKHHEGLEEWDNKLQIFKNHHPTKQKIKVLNK